MGTISNDTKQQDIQQIKVLLKALANQDFDPEPSESDDLSSNDDIIPRRKLKRRASQFIMAPQEFVIRFTSSVFNW